MGRAFAATLAIFLAACGGGGPGSSSGGFSIAVTMAESQYGIGALTPPSSRFYAVVTVAVSNTSASAPILAAAPLFSVTTSGAIKVPVSGAVASLDSPCTNLSVGQGGQLSCELAFEIPTGDTPVELDYDDGMGHTAATAVPALTDGTCSLVTSWKNTTGSACTSCTQEAVAEGTCPNAQACTQTEVVCIAMQVQMSGSAAFCSAAAACSVSTACAAAWQATSDCVVFRCNTNCR